MSPKRPDNAEHLPAPSREDAMAMAGVLFHFVGGSTELRERLAKWMEHHEGDLDESFGVRNAGNVNETPAQQMAAYVKAREKYETGTGTDAEIDALKDAMVATVTPEVAAQISADEREAAKRRASDREAIAWAAECVARRRRTKRVTALVREHRVVSFMVAVIVALLVVPWSVYGPDSKATGMGIFAAYVLMLITSLGVAIRNFYR